MGCKARKHCPLRLGCQMEKAVPSDDRCECPPKGQTPHVSDMKVVSWKPLSAKADKGFGDVKPGDDKASANQVRRDGFTRAASEVEHMGTGLQRCGEPIQPGTLEAILAPDAIKGFGVARIQSGNGIRV